MNTDLLSASEQKIQIPQEFSNKKKKWIILVCILFLIFIPFGFYFLSKTSVKPSQFISQPIITPTPLPFAEITIPYLRQKEYKSNLGDLNKVSENASYTSYLASYTSDGLKINGLLTIPKNPEPVRLSSRPKPVEGFPAIVFVHGYIAPTIYRTLERYIDHVDYLSRNGFVVFKIDLRGHGDSEGSPGGGYFGSDYIIDALNARAALQASDFVNPKAIGFWGHSMAGNVLMRSFATKPDIPAVVIWSGAVYSYVDRDKYGINDNSYRPPGMTTGAQSRRQRLFERHGSPSAESIFWKAVAPTNYLGDLKGAIQIHHAVDDSVVDIGYSRDLIALLDETSVPHELWEYPSGGHNIIGISFTQAMQRTVEFYKKYLK